MITLLVCSALIFAAFLFGAIVGAAAERSASQHKTKELEARTNAEHEAVKVAVASLCDAIIVAHEDLQQSHARNMELAELAVKIAQGLTAPNQIAIWPDGKRH
jgi:Na+-transporting methylmalonyl-CoA/oxaloacetate decarboxylase gamma subunit